MKKVAGTLKIDQAQYRELEAFSKFGSDLDAATMSVIGKGKRNVEILKQAENSPVPVEKQVAIIYLGTKGLLNHVPVENIKEFEEEYLHYLESHHEDVLQTLRKGVINEEVTKQLEKVGADLSEKYRTAK